MVWLFYLILLWGPSVGLLSFAVCSLGFSSGWDVSLKMGRGKGSLALKTCNPWEAVGPLPVHPKEASLFPGLSELFQTWGWVAQTMPETSWHFKVQEGSATHAESIDPESPVFPWCSYFWLLPLHCSLVNNCPGGKESHSGDFLRNQLLLRKGNSLEWGWEEKEVLSDSIIFRIPMSKYNFQNVENLTFHKVSMCQRFN